MGGSGHEIELKLQLPDEASLEAVAVAAGGERRAPVRQVNHFFDADGRPLRARGFGLRLRDEEGRFFLTAKGPKGAAKSAALAHRREEEVEIDADTARAILGGARSPLEVLQERLEDEGLELVRALDEARAGAPLEYLGCFENQRTRIRTKLPSAQGDLDVELELDRTSFPGDRVQFEVELELSASADADNAERALVDLLARAGTVGRPAPGKARRFFAFLEEERE